MEIILVRGALVPMLHTPLFHVKRGQYDLILQLLSMWREDAENVLVECWRGVRLNRCNEFVGVMVLQLTANLLQHVVKEID